MDDFELLDLEFLKFKCTICNQTFTREDSLKRHIKTLHIANKPKRKPYNMDNKKRKIPDEFHNASNYLKELKQDQNNPDIVK